MSPEPVVGPGQIDVLGAQQAALAPQLANFNAKNAQNLAMTQGMFDLGSSIIEAGPSSIFGVG